MFLAAFWLYPALSAIHVFIAKAKISPWFATELELW